MTTALETETDIPEGFDPELHMVDEEGKPRVTNAGKPMKKRGPRKGTAPSPRRATAPRASTRKPASGTDYRPGILGLFQLAAVPLAFKAPADAAAVTHHAPPIADALNDLARERPEVAAVLEKVLSAGPYGALLAAVVPLGVQLLHNHDLMPESVATGLGATPKRVILESLRVEAEGAEGGVPRAA
jgi:hypothetical protein